MLTEYLISITCTAKIPLIHISITSTAFKPIPELNFLTIPPGTEHDIFRLVSRYANPLP